MPLSLLTDLYPWTKAFHIVGVIAWMAGMFYLPRLYVYHCGAPEKSIQSETFKIMEYKLLRFIINPAMVLAFLFGGMLLATPGVVDWSQGWIYVKLSLALVMSAFHGALSIWRRAFAEDRNRHPARFYRIMNEVPTVLMIAIVVMAVVRPF